jgi:hypothetical protein
MYLCCDAQLSLNAFFPYKFSGILRVLGGGLKIILYNDTSSSGPIELELELKVSSKAQA